MVVKEHDDLLSATRVALMELRAATTRPPAAASGVSLRGRDERMGVVTVAAVARAQER